MTVGLIVDYIFWSCLYVFVVRFGVFADGSNAEECGPDSVRDLGVLVLQR